MCSILYLPKPDTTATSWEDSTLARATRRRLTASAAHQQSNLWRMSPGERASMTMPSPVLVRSRRSSPSYLYVNILTPMRPPLTCLGVSRHHPLLHVGFRIRSTRCPEQALPGDPSRHCRSVLWSSGVSRSFLSSPTTLTKTVRTLEPTSLALLLTAGGLSVSLVIDGRSLPVSASTV